jgi:hypothetical protein
MDNLERYLDRVCRGLGGSASLRRHLRQELREHILEAAERYKADGLSSDDALAKAIADFGDSSSVHQGLEDVYGRDLMGILIEKAMQWKEKTLKAKWLWSAAASLFLVLAILAQGFFVFCVPWLIVPAMREAFKAAGERLPAYAVAFLTFANVAMYSEWIWVWISVLLVAWILFEWRCRSENKPLIRLSALGLVSLATTALVYWSGIVAVSLLLHAQAALYHQRPEEVMLQRAQKADEAMARLSSALQVDDWHAVHDAMHDFSDALGEVESQGSAPAGLVTMTRTQQLDDIRSQLDVLMHLCMRVSIAAQDRMANQLRERSQEMQRAYDKLKALVGSWPAPATQPASQPGAGPSDAQ